MSGIVRPDKVSFYQWGNSLRQNEIDLIVPNPDKTPEDWWKWASLLIAVNRLAYITLPDKRMFPAQEDWRKWAWLFIKNYELV